MRERRLFERDRLGAALTGVEFGLVVGLLEWWGPIWHHSNNYAIAVGFGFGFVFARAAYGRGVQPRLALALPAAAAVAICLVLGTDAHDAARVIAGSLMFAFGLVALCFVLRLTPEQVEQAQRSERADFRSYRERHRWLWLLPSHYRWPGPWVSALPPPLARLALAAVPLLLCVFGVAVLLRLAR